MAAKPETKPDPKDEKSKEPDLFPPIASGFNADGLRWEEVSILGTKYRFREISVAESDAAYDASENPDKTYNSRLGQRMELVASVEEPTIALDDIERWGVRKLRAMLYVYSRVNTLDPADAEGNA